MTADGQRRTSRVAGTPFQARLQEDVIIMSRMDDGYREGMSRLEILILTLNGTLRHGSMLTPTDGHRDIGTDTCDVLQGLSRPMLDANWQ